MAEFHDEGYFLPTVRGEVDSFFNQALRPLARRGIAIDMWNPQLDVTEEESRFLLEMDLPGVRREDISLEVQGSTLIIAGKRNIVRRAVGARYSHCERVSGSFRRVVRLPREVDEERISALVEEGILRVELPKKGMGL